MLMDFSSCICLDVFLNFTGTEKEKSAEPFDRGAKGSAKCHFVTGQ